MRDGTVRIWEPNGKLIHTLQGHTAGVSSVMFSPNDQMLASISFKSRKPRREVSSVVR